MPMRNVYLTEHFDSFIAAGIEAGSYSNASEAVLAALRLLEQEDQVKVEWLRGAAQDGINALERGDYTALRSHAEISTFVRSAGSERP